MLLARAFVAAAALVIHVAALAGEFEGMVVGIADGDTLRVLVDRHEVVIRLDQIDAPEKGQAFGQRSRESLADLAFEKTVRVIDHGRDRYGRTIGTIFVDDVNINDEQVRRGMAWVFVRYVREPRLFEIERVAREEKRGLWVDRDPIPPWEWRDQKRH
jgi:endonuclease YncB( thermonuclease family)